ncbi:MAG: bifunctional 3-deoxy-7-phosphoheptulonate synthase/chorismate mutase [Deltaproteobacteria bacterium]|nr:bifunctional 3-deoxy-7-phosphoheptulonate synthase/chorismate mutase [Deltaproteobacteria bacterium]
MSDDKLDVLRRRISEVNRRLLDDLNERLRLVNEVRELKQERGLAMSDPAREEQMMQELLASNPGPMTEGQLQEVFKVVFSVYLSHMERSARQGLRVHRREGEADRTVEARGLGIGGAGTPVLIAGPCAIEDEQQLRRTAAHLAGLGCRLLRGGAYKPRTSPYSFQGLGNEGWRLLRQVADEHGMAVVSEVVDPRHLEEMGELVDVVQVGARNMFNYELLKELGQIGKPVLLKRSFMATLEELVLAAEYVASQGNDRIVLCERGIRSFERWTRNTLDISAVPLLKQVTALPVIVDVAHAAGRRDILVPLARASLAAGADGIMIEVSPFPASAASDAEHQLDLEATTRFVEQVFGKRG